MGTTAERVTPTRVVLVRHGEPDESVRGRCYGHLDPGLSLLGQQQMRKSRRLLREAPVSIVYSSPRRRALESARLLVPRGITASVDDRLREIDFGELEGLTYDEIALRYPEIYEQWMRRPTEAIFPGGESFHAMTVRVREALDQLRRSHPGALVVVVSHGGVNRIAIADALGLDPARIFRLDQTHGCINIIDFFGDEPLVRTVNLQPVVRFNTNDTKDTKEKPVLLFNTEDTKDTKERFVLPFNTKDPTDTKE